MCQCNVIGLTCFFKYVNVSAIVFSKKRNTTITSRIPERRPSKWGHIYFKYNLLWVSIIAIY